MEAAAKFSDPSYLESIVGTDDILKVWSSHRQAMHQALTTKQDPDYLHKIIPVDFKCRSRGGIGIRPYNLRQQCPGCILLTKLCPNGILPDTFAICLEAGKYKHSCLEVHMIDIYGSNFIEYKSNRKIAGDLVKVIREPTYPALALVSFFGTHNWVTNYATVSAFIQEEMRRAKLPWSPSYLWSYGCSSKTFLIDKQYDLMPTMTVSLLTDIIKQLIAMSGFLSQFGFINGKATIDLLGIDKRPISCQYNGVTIKSPICIRPIPSKNTSITINGVRYFYGGSSYYHESVDQPIEKLVPFFSSFKGMCVPEKTAVPSLIEIQSCRILGYHIGNRIHTFHHYMCYEGIPLMTTSYELYSYFISLLAVKSNFDLLMSQPVLAKFFEGCWNPREYSDLIRDLQREFHSREVCPNSQDILNFLAKYTLRFDMLSYCLYQLPSL